MSNISKFKKLVKRSRGSLVGKVSMSVSDATALLGEIELLVDQEPPEADQELQRRIQSLELEISELTANTEKKPHAITWSGGEF